MTWARLDDGFWSHPKVLAAGNEDVGVFARAISYCACHETDGRIPTEIAEFIGPKQAMERLSVMGLVERNGDGYVITDYLDYNKSHRELDEDRERKRQAGLASGKARKK